MDGFPSEAPQKGEKPEGDDWVCVCPICQYHTVALKAMHSHINSSHIDVPVLTSAGKVFPDIFLGTDTTSVTEETSDTYTCIICGKSDLPEDVLNRHMHMEHVFPTCRLSKPLLSQKDSGSNESHSSGFHTHKISNDEYFNKNSKSSSRGKLAGTGGITSEISSSNPTAKRESLNSAGKLVKRESCLTNSPPAGCRVNHRSTANFQSDQQLAENLEREFKEEETRRLQEEYGMVDYGDYKKQFLSDLEHAAHKQLISAPDYHQHKSHAFECWESGFDEGISCTKGIITAILNYYRVSQYSKFAVLHLCSETDHYATSYGDRGWGCGYRNLQMLLSSLAKDNTYRKLIFGTDKNPVQMLSIPRLQEMLEEAWRKGFDTEGSKQLGERLKKTRKWIGASDVVALLSSLKLRCHLIDVYTVSNMFEWIVNYFSKKNRFIPPLFLQHQGHSRTVVGVEQNRNGQSFLLLFDPSSSKKHMERFTKEVNRWLIRTLHKAQSDIQEHKVYQLIAVEGSLNDEELDKSKILRSERL